MDDSENHTEGGVDDAGQRHGCQHCRQVTWGKSQIVLKTVWFDNTTFGSIRYFRICHLKCSHSTKDNRLLFWSLIVPERTYKLTSLSKNDNILLMRCKNCRNLIFRYYLQILWRCVTFVFASTKYWFETSNLTSQYIDFHDISFLKRG